MQKLVAKVDEMKTQRQKLEQQLRDHIRDDDVTGGIVTRTKGSMQVKLPTATPLSVFFPIHSDLKHLHLC